MQTQLLKIEEGSYKDALYNQSLISEHWEELESRKDILQVNVDYERFEMLEKAGMLLTLIAKQNTEVVGYSINILSTHLHHKDTLMCYNDLLFLTKSKRNGTLGIKLINHTEELAKVKGAKMMFWHSKTNTPLSKILPRMGNTLYEQVFLKEL